jgi:hypothetical protein
MAEPSAPSWNGVDTGGAADDQNKMLASGPHVKSLVVKRGSRSSCGARCGLRVERRRDGRESDDTLGAAFLKS